MERIENTFPFDNKRSCNENKFLMKKDCCIKRDRFLITDRLMRSGCSMRRDRFMRKDYLMKRDRSMRRYRFIKEIV